MKKAETLNIFGEILKKKRATRGWSQRRLAVKLNTSHLCVWKWETGRALPNFALLVEIADLFNCSVDELIGRQSAVSAWGPPVKIGDKVYSALIPVLEIDDPVVEEYEVEGVGYNGKWLVLHRGYWFEVGDDLCRLTREDAESIIEEWRQNR